MRQDRGFTLTLAALILVPLLVLSAMAVDVGAWFSRGSGLQKAADAAALAGVVWMPDFDKAADVALETAARNGFVDGVDGITVTPAKVSGNDQQLKVTVADSNAPQFFSQLVLDKVAINRAATGEYILPVPLGSPKNIFGTGSLTFGASTPENFWAAVNGYCSGHESGDLKLAFWESYDTTASATAQCNNGSVGTADYDPEGYLYAVELPASSGQLTLQAYDPSYMDASCPGGGSSPDLRLSGELQTITTTFQMYDRDDTPLSSSDNPLVTTYTANSCDATNRNTWRTLHTFTSPQAGTYYIRVKTAAQTTESRGSNGFGLRAYTGASFSLCSTITTDVGYSASCPQVHGVDDMSIFANLGGAAGSTAAFYLAEVDPVHAGKTMKVSLFDSGEGASAIEVLDPNGNPVTFDWSTKCTNPPAPATGGCSGSGSSLNVSGTGTQPVSGLISTSKYNDRTMDLEIDIPSDYTAQYGTKVWWKIRYTLGSNPTDRTTWSVVILGDPVHLVG